MTNTRVGIIGCGNISSIYFTNAPKFAGIEVVACADVREDAARAQGARFNVAAQSVDELLANAEVDIVVNLTVPTAHHAISMKAFAAGKHVFSEKPLGVDVTQGRELVVEAKRRGVRLGVAPDTFLGPGSRKAREIIEDGKVGKIISGSAFLMSRGMEHWHPDPEFFYKPGGGPVLDLGPYYITTLVSLLGPVRSVAALASSGSPTRTITAMGPRTGQVVKVETPTTVSALLGFASGAQITLTLSWDVWAHGHPPVELYGLEGSLRLPSPIFFGGTVEFAVGTTPWHDEPSDSAAFGKPNYPADEPVHANYRVLGIADMAAAIRDGRPHRASGELGLHVLEVLFAILDASRDGKIIVIEGGEQPVLLSEREAASFRNSGSHL
jgi:predicted dehydrogenase